jgi:hypothetical protein
MSLAIQRGAWMLCIACRPQLKCRSFCVPLSTPFPSPFPTVHTRTRAKCLDCHQLSKPCVGRSPHCADHTAGGSAEACAARASVRPAGHTRRTTAAECGQLQQAAGGFVAHNSLTFDSPACAKLMVWQPSGLCDMLCSMHADVDASMLCCAIACI